MENRLTIKNKTVKNHGGVIIPLTTFFFIFKNNIIDNNAKLVNALKTFFITNSPSYDLKDNQSIITYLNELNTSKQATATNQGVFNLSKKKNVIHFLLILNYINKETKGNSYYSPHLRYYTEKALESIQSKTEKNAIAKTLNKVRIWKDSNETVSKIDITILSRILELLPVKTNDEKLKYTTNAALNEILEIMKAFNSMDIAKENVSTKYILKKDPNELTNYDIDGYVREFLEIQNKLEKTFEEPFENNNDIFENLKSECDRECDREFINESITNKNIYRMILILNSAIISLNNLKEYNINDHIEYLKNDSLQKEDMSSDENITQIKKNNDLIHYLTYDKKDAELKNNIRLYDFYVDILVLIMSISNYYNSVTKINTSHFYTYVFDMEKASNQLQFMKLNKIFDIDYFNNKEVTFKIVDDYDSTLHFFYEKLLKYRESNAFITNVDVLQTLFCIFYYCSVSYMMNDPNLKKALPKKTIGITTPLIDSDATSKLVKVSLIDNIMFVLYDIINIKNRKDSKNITENNEVCKKWENYLFNANANDGVLDQQLLGELQKDLGELMDTIDSGIKPVPNNGDDLMNTMDSGIKPVSNDGDIDKIYEQVDEIYKNFFDKNKPHTLFTFLNLFSKIKYKEKADRSEIIDSIQKIVDKENVSFKRAAVKGLNYLGSGVIYMTASVLSNFIKLD